MSILNCLIGCLDPVTGTKKYLKIIWPIKEAVTVNERRRQAGFEQTVEDNARRLGIVYHVYTLAQVHQLKQAGH
ncbi:hypothetical protein KLP40_03955 [Hymenobacter sp. NST-14]|uniref:hypothetical protein n=1 Tax=Hymenobacter piscis TaxID=2839984 RepID=UPI001C01CFB8|nr:hypothetical protein [Hymenobacter piscis]MBT9392307.1 hypothetical protein [Hymenobacter piscis]